MSTALLDATVAYLRARFTRAEVFELRAYAGEFNAQEIDYTSFTCPAIFPTVLGWRPTLESRRLTGRNVRSVSMAAWVVVKDATSREKRMAQAALLAERATLALRLWQPPEVDAPFELAPLEEEPAAENLYSRAVDAKGLAMWQLTWEQCIKPRVTPEQLFDLLAVEITDLVHGGQVPATVPGTVPNASTLTVTEDIQFPPAWSAP